MSKTSIQFNYSQTFMKWKYGLLSVFLNTKTWYGTKAIFYLCIIICIRNMFTISTDGISKLWWFFLYRRQTCHQRIVFMGGRSGRVQNKANASRPTNTRNILWYFCSSRLSIQTCVYEKNCLALGETISMNKDENKSHLRLDTVETNHNQYA